MLLMLQAGSPDRRLKRNVRDDDGNVVRRYEFAPGIPVHVEDDDIDATPSIQKDLRNQILVAVEVDPKTNHKTVLDLEFDDENQPKKPTPKKSGKKPDPKKVDPPKTDPPATT